MKLIFLLFLIHYAYSSLPCALRKYPDGYVCVCNNTYCDTINEVLPDNNNSVVVLSTSKGGLRFNVEQGIKTDSNNPNKIIVTDYDNETQKFNKDTQPPVIINIDDSQKYQQILGFGGAFTGAVAYNLDLMDKPLVDLIYKSYFSFTDGIAYNMMRLSIGGSDFDLEPWAYNELPIDDKDLSNFTKLDQRDFLKVEQIKRLKEVSNNNDIKLMCAAWSPPKWMKTNNEWTGRSALKKEYYQTWADYHIRFLELMSKENINFWSISTGNEPSNALIGNFLIQFLSLGWTPSDQAVWISENFGPSIKNSKFKDLQIYGGDDQRYIFPLWFTAIDIYNSKAMEYIDAFATHWYFDGVVPPAVLDQTHENFPDKIILQTESCYDDKPWKKETPIVGSWDRAEKYAKYIIENLDHWVAGWIDWNLVLNEQGGPNYIEFFVDSTIIVNTTIKNEAYKQSSFYVMGHFSRYVVEGSVKIHSDSSALNTIAFLRPDNIIVVIVYNKYDYPYDITIKDKTRGEILVSIPQRSIHTIIYK